jgi:hypothetical protein
MLGWDEIEGELGNTHWVQGNYIPAQDALMGAADFQDFPTN